jgi:hypothetical protein
MKLCLLIADHPSGSCEKIEARRQVCGRRRPAGAPSVGALYLQLFTRIIFVWR